MKSQVDHKYLLSGIDTCELARLVSYKTIMSELRQATLLVV